MATPAKSKAKKNKNNSTGYNGVIKLANGKYIAQIFHEGKTLRSKEQRKKATDAAKDYDTMATELKGEKAKLNFPSKA